ncbi:hypothetical protein RRF57_012139 [Xylaria bambusicola]|uniref:NAD-dependent epimerase/dehydratase domain-containing protein n=1 Tax=Xylaria bambusicola TaxID=326684 RepID=A0AAN7ZAG3_9PEZI
MLKGGTSVSNAAPERVWRRRTGFVALMLATAKSKGMIAYSGTEENRWLATHTLDVARAYRLALEIGKAGSVFHPIADGGVRTKDIVEVLARKLDVPVVTTLQE